MRSHMSESAPPVRTAVHTPIADPARSITALPTQDITTVRSGRVISTSTTGARPPARVRIRRTRAGGEQTTPTPHRGPPRSPDLRLSKNHATIDKVDLMASGGAHGNTLTCGDPTS